MTYFAGFLGHHRQILSGTSGTCAPVDTFTPGLTYVSRAQRSKGKNPILDQMRGVSNLNCCTQTIVILHAQTY